MQNFGASASSYGVENHGIRNANTVYWHLTTPMLYEQAVRRREAVIAHLGPLIVRTGDHTGRSPNDKFVVKEPTSEKDIWWGKVNRPIDQEKFDNLLRRIQAYLQNRDLFVFDGYAGADPNYRMPVRVMTEFAWHNLFARNMFLREMNPEKLHRFVPEFTVIDMPQFHADPQFDGTNSQTFILVDFGKRLVLIGGTAYAGEIKKSIFTAMNYYLPKRGVMSMHCSANYGRDADDVALFFGLSGTGKTTLSNDPQRTLIGDDEHGWSDDGVFNFEGGCYAKVIRLDPKGEPEIYDTTRRFGTILENVAYDAEIRRIDLDDDSLTENTRASYPLTHIGNVDLSGTAGHPRHIIFLTADAFGVLPPISRLTGAQAMYHFLSGYTAKVAGTERGITEPKATFSVCFGAPFMPLHPGAYARLLGEKLERLQARVWLVNTGWTGGPYGVGSRMKLSYTRRMVTAALGGELDNVELVEDPIFGLRIPAHVEDVPDEALRPRQTWQNPEEYDAQAARLARMFVENFDQFADGVAADIRTAGPRV
ncbi:MAG: phosphoenolpyruvate carboxykinase (ATP) [Chloroflexi bacterium]|nr:phosphoenolpyruvate carboxykinase (ATP) [Chloroflexota bacterium]MCI0577335.1 phosphoenolpyruvate carboxykinase (ATP) [Chloroflexota bacterium]MCI0648135.1 phosphoenolpyruvate carboxykinase (ATP) [Chloroflexota bacterium]MCI0725993.1 phosphoenolpyruvate carboxykinase (ATP) [Chloroflexota bacterium]